ncbi:response regulator transcription factor [Spirochaeta cellobiosiphila]|uniref:response regulator transcription factor n=1 Tax=Spirochaeta cellobiosiphila TaxID=504483 RepID=UPI000409CEA8|nr:response regulator transcription factor [Spirochaeta cellobiosiphila]
MDNKTIHVLIIEDDREISQLIGLHIKDLGYKAEYAYDGNTGLTKALSGQYDLVILDIMLPQKDGLSLCKELRSQNNNVPLLMLTAKAEEIDRVLGLELGADDYLTKPFSIRELIARIKALLRRSHIQQPPLTENELVLGELVINEGKRRATLKGNILDLTAKEFELLTLFSKNPGRAYSRRDLLNIIWGYDFDGYEHTVNTHINRLRNKIESDLNHPRYLITVWGVGYRFAEERELK